MSDQPTNLNKARKARAHAAKERQAVENRVKFGRTKAQKQAEKAAQEKARSTAESRKLEH